MCVVVEVDGHILAVHTLPLVCMCMCVVVEVDGHILAVHTLPLVYVYVCSGGGGWAHISCALWIPEVRFGVPERMKNIIINQVPVSCTTFAIYRVLH